MRRRWNGEKLIVRVVWVVLKILTVTWRLGFRPNGKFHILMARDVQFLEASDVPMQRLPDIGLRNQQPDSDSTASQVPC